MLSLICIILLVNLVNRKKCVNLFKMIVRILMIDFELIIFGLSGEINWGLLNVEMVDFCC